MNIVGVIPEHILRLMPKEAREPLGKAGLTMPEINDANAVKLERELHRQIEQELNRRGITYRHDRMDRKPTCRVGMPDFQFAIAGQPIAVECKAPGGRLSEEQIEVGEGLLADGWTYIVVTRLEQVIELFKPKCGWCGGSGQIDSGGFTPWGAGISVARPDCKTMESK